MVQLMTQMLYLLDKIKENIVDKNRQSQLFKISYIYQMGYYILQNIAKNNKRSKQRISWYLPQYFKQIMKKQNSAALKPISEILQDNLNAIQQIVNKQTITNLVINIDQIKNFEQRQSDQQNLKFLSVLCICKQRSVKENQTVILKEFFNYNKQKKFVFREDHKKVQISSKLARGYSERFRTLPQLYQDSKQLVDQMEHQNNKSHWSYFLQYLNLLSDVCVHRNIQGQQFVESILGLKKLVTLVFEPIVNELGCYQPFIKVIHHAYIDAKPFTEISKIAKVKYWYQKNEKFDIPRTQTKIKPQLQQIMSLIKYEINSFKYFNPTKINQLKNTLTFLNLLKCTLNLGFWSTINQIQEFVPCILRMLRFDYQFAFEKPEMHQKQEISTTGRQQELELEQSMDIKKIVSLNKGKLLMNNEENNLLINCKILAAEIMDIMLDMENNIRVSWVAKLFKDILQMNIDISQFEKKYSQQQQEQRTHSNKQKLLLNQQLWISKLNQMLQRRNIFSQVSQQELNKTLILFQICHYKNPTLINHSISLLKRIFGQRSQVLENFCKVILVGQGQFKQLSNKATNIRTKLLVLSNHNIVNVTLKTQYNFEYQIWPQQTKHQSQQKGLGIIQQLGFLSQVMKDGYQQGIIEIFKNNFYQFSDLYPYTEFTDRDQMGNNNGVYSIITEKQKNNKLHQSLIRSQDHHLILLDFIKNMGEKNLESHQYQLSAKTLHAAYNFLTVLIWNHKQNKNLMIEHISKFQKHIKFNVGCIQFLKELYINNKRLIYNQTYISSLIDKVIQTANQLSLTVYYKSKLMDFLRVLVIFDDKGHKKNQNLVMEVISRYQVSQNNRTVFVQNSSHFHINFDDLKQWIKISDKHYETCKITYVYDIGPELTYIATFFQVFSALIENNNIINQGKCTNMHPYPYLVEMLQIVGYCWPVTRFLRAYINKLYYSIVEYDTNIFELFIEMDLFNIKRQLKQIARLIENYKYYNQIRIKYPIRYCYLGSFVYCTLQQILFGLNSMLNKENLLKSLPITLSQNESRQKFEIHECLIELIELIGYLIKKKESRYINRYLNKAQQTLRIYLSSFPMNYLKKKEEENKIKINEIMKQNHDYSEQIPYKTKYIYYKSKSFFKNLVDMIYLKKNQLKRQKINTALQKRLEKGDSKKSTLSAEQQKNKEKEYIIDSFILGNIQKKIKNYKKIENKDLSKRRIRKNLESKISQTAPKNLTTSSSHNFRIKNQPQLPYNQQNQLLNRRRNLLKDFILKNQEFQRYYNQEFLQFCQQLQKLNQISEKTYGFVVIGAEDIIRSMVEINQMNSRALNFQIKLTFFILLTNYIGLNVPTKLIIDEWNVSDWSEYKNKIFQAQNFLNKCGCANFLCSIIKQGIQSIDMINQLFLFGIAFLLGGNSLCQNQIYDILLKDESNSISSQLYSIFKKIIKNVGSYLKIKKSQNSYKKSVDKIYLITADTYDYYNEQQNIMQRKFGYSPQIAQQNIQTAKTVKAVKRAYIFLKLLSQNNNINMKNFIRQQINQDNSIKTNSVNFIEMTTFELRRLIKIMNNKLVAMPLSLMQFLYQVTQIPCVQNQKSLCKSTFFEDICFMSNYFDELTHCKNRQIGSSEKLIMTQFYNKSISILINCLEGNDEKIYQELIDKLQPGFIIRTIKLNLEKNHLYSVEHLQQVIKNQGYMHNQQIRQMLNIMFVVQKLGHFQKKNKFSQFQQEAKRWEQQLANIIKRLKQEINCIEITIDSKNQSLFFPNHPVFNYLSRQTRDKIMFQVNRDTPRDKLIGLFSYKQQIFSQIQYNFDLKHYKLPISLATIDFFRKWANYFSLIIDVFMLYVMQVQIGFQADYVQYTFSTKQTAYTMQLLALTQLCLTVNFFLFWLINRTPLAISKNNYEVQKRMQKNIIEQNQEVNNFSFYFIKKGKQIVDKIFGYWPIMAIFSLFKYQNQFTNILAFVVASLLGAFYKIQFFAFHLFDTVGRIDILQNVVQVIMLYQAVTQNFKQLGVVSLLGVSFICVFSVFSFSSYVQSIYPQKMPAEHCQTVPSCIITLYISEQIGSELQQFQIFRFVFDLIYTIFMDMLFGNIISGIMIDTFASLRDKRKTIELDKKNFCFICGISRSSVKFYQQLEKNLKQLQMHIKQNKHYLWNYIFYLYGLKNKKNNNEKITGLEYQILNKQQNEDVSWIPLQEDIQDDSEKKITELVQTMQILSIERQKKLQYLKSQMIQIQQQ